MKGEGCETDKGGHIDILLPSHPQCSATPRSPPSSPRPPPLRPVRVLAMLASHLLALLRPALAAAAGRAIPAVALVGSLEGNGSSKVKQYLHFFLYKNHL